MNQDSYTERKKVHMEKSGHTILQPAGKVFKKSDHYLFTASSALTNDQPATKLPDELLPKLFKMNTRPLR